jgi:Aspartyl protease
LSKNKFIKASITILCFFLSGISLAQTKGKKPASKLLETIPFEMYTGGVVIFQAKIGDDTTNLSFILDTGSGGLSLDSSTCAELNIRTKPSDTSIMGIAGTKKVAYAFNQKLTTGNLVTDSLNFYVNDYSLLSSVYGARVDGIIGYGFLSKYIFKINYDSALMHIFSKGNFMYEKGGTTIYPNFNKLVTHTISIRDKAKVDGNIYLDSGAGLSLLLTNEFIKDKNLLLSRRKPLETQVQGLGGKKSMRLTVVKRIKIGPYVFRQVPTNLFDDETKVIAYPYSCGLIGNDILRPLIMRKKKFI